MNSSLSKFSGVIFKTFPGLPFLAFGVWFAWSTIAYNGSTWLSDTELDGTYIVLMFAFSTGTFAVTCFAIQLLQKKFGIVLIDSRFTLVAGVFASIGAFLIVAAGPYLLNVRFLFYIGSIITGIGTAFVALRIAYAYSGISLSQMLLYTALSQLVVIFICACLTISPQWPIVEGSPGIISTIAFVVLPFLTAALAICPSHYLRYGEHKIFPGSEKLSISSDLVLFLFVVFIVSLVTGMLRATVVAPGDLSDTQFSENIILLLRFPICLVVLIVAYTSRKSERGIGRIYSLVIVLMILALAFVAVFQSSVMTVSIVTNAVYSIFTIIVWVLMTYSTRQKNVCIFGIVYGVHMASALIGWFLGAYVVPGIPSGIMSIVYFAFAAVLLVFAVLLFGEGSLNRLFSPILESDLYIEDVDDNQGLFAEAEGEDLERKGWFSGAIETLSSEHGLTARESDVFRLLAMGYGSDAVAEKLVLSISTVRTHTHNLYVKLDVHSRNELIAKVSEFRHKT